MSYPVRSLGLLLIFLAAPVGAADKPSVKAKDTRKAALLRAGYTPVPITIDPVMMMAYVDGAVGPEKVRFRLYNGSSATMLEMAVAKRLNLELGEKVGGESLSGSHSGRVVELPGLTIGNYDTRKDCDGFRGLACDLSGSSTKPTGMIGSDVLDNWGAVIDYGSRTLYLRSPLVNAWPRLEGAWTVTRWQEDGADRKLDPKAPPIFTFANKRLKLTDRGKTRDYDIQILSAEGLDQVFFFEPKREGKPEAIPLGGSSTPQAGGLLKIEGGRMTACLALDIAKAKQPPMELAAPKGSGLVLLELKRTTPGPKKLADPFRELMVKSGYTAVPMMQKDPDAMRVVEARIGEHTLRLQVDTGSNATAFDSSGLDKWGARRLGRLGSQGLGGGMGMIETVSLRGMKIGGYDTRRAWEVVYGAGVDLTGMNIGLAADKLPAIHGLLGNLELLDSSAVIDFHTNTLYLRPVKETLWPQLEGKWVGTAWESEGQKGAYKPGDAAIEFKDGRLKFATSAGSAEWGFHLEDLGNRYRVGLFATDVDPMADKFTYSSAGLLRVSGDKLTLVMQRNSRNEPKAFASPVGSGTLLVEYQRAR